MAFSDRAGSFKPGSTPFEIVLFRGADKSFHICYDFYKKGCNLFIHMLKY